MQENNAQGWKHLQATIFRMVSIGTISDTISRSYDIIGSIVLVMNLVVSFMLTYDNLVADYGSVLNIIEAVTVALFAMDYVLRLLTAECLYPAVSRPKALIKYILSWAGLVDLLSFLPFYLPVFFPTGAAAFRMFRVARIFRLFRINHYYDSMNVISEVIQRKKQQLISSMFIILILMLASSLCMYSVEHPVQPDVFKNAFSGIWWSASALLTIGYGDIYPVTFAGQALSMVIAFLGVGMVAIPTGIISAGFVEQYQRFQKLSDYGIEMDIRFIEIKVRRDDAWAGKEIRELGIPHGMMISVIIRDNDTITPEGHLVIQAGDRLIIGAKSIKSEHNIELKEITLKRDHPWNGEHIRDLDISRQSFIVMLKRHGKGIIPKGETILCEGDKVVLYTRREATELIDDDNSVEHPVR